MQTVFPPRSPGNSWAYWKVTRLADLPTATKRRRKTISFILTPEGLREHGGATCVHCHNSIDHNDDKGTYGEYNPRTRRAKLWHYPCGWGAVLNDIILNNGAAREVLAPENIQL